MWQEVVHLQGLQLQRKEVMRGALGEGKAEVSESGREEFLQRSETERDKENPRREERS